MSEACLASDRLYLRDEQLKHSAGLDGTNTEQGQARDSDRVTGAVVSVGAVGFNSLIKQNYSDML